MVSIFGFGFENGWDTDKHGYFVVQLSFFPCYMWTKCISLAAVVILELNIIIYQSVAPFFSCSQVLLLLTDSMEIFNSSWYRTALQPFLPC